MRLTLIFFIVFPIAVWAQSPSVNLEDCMSKAIAKWPGTGNAKNALDMGTLKQRNAQNSNYPQLSINGQASWQSDVTQVTLPIPNMSLPEMPHDQYKIYLDVNQVLYDGGVSSSKTKMEMLSANTDSVQVMVDSRKIKEMVIDLYYNVIYFRKASEVAEAQLQRLNKRLVSMKSSNINGVLSGNDYMLFNAEVKKAEQSLEDLKMNEISVLQSLTILTGMELKPETPFVTPGETESLSAEIKRPEFSLFVMQKDIFTLSQQMSGKTMRPRLSAFAQGGYGRPALNMFSTEFDNYLMAGVRLNWNLYDWGQSKREKQIYDIRKKSVENTENNLRQTIDMQMSQQKFEIERIDKQLKKDDEIVEIYNQVLVNSAISLEQGIITPVDYLEKETLHKVAVLEKVRHEVQLMKARTALRFIKGEL